MRNATPGCDIYRLRIQRGTATRLGTLVRIEDGGHQGGSYGQSWYDNRKFAIVRMNDGQETNVLVSDAGTYDDVVWTGLEIITEAAQ